MLRGKICKAIRRVGACAERLTFAAAICAMLLALFAAGARAAVSADAPKSSITLEQYETELGRLGAAVAALGDHPEQAESLRQSLPAGWTVDVDGQKYDVSLAWLTADLQEIANNPNDAKALCDKAAAQLRKFRGEAEKLSATPAPDSNAARARLEQILRQREFRPVQKESWMGELWDQIQRWIDWLLGHTLGRLMEEGTVKTLVVWAVIIAIFLCVAVWLVRSLRALVRSEALKMDATFPPGKLWRDWARESLAAAAAGDYRAAIHLSYWAGVYRLAELGAWQLDRARTPREYLRMLMEQPRASAEGARSDVPARAEGSGDDGGPAERAAALAALTRSMESAWYGFSPATKQDFEAAVNQLERLGCRLRSTAQTASS